MRILHVSSVYAPHFIGGAERCTQVIAEGSVQQGHEAAVACITPAREQSRQLNGVDVLPLAHRNPLWVGTVASYPGILRKVSKVATLFNVLTTKDIKQILVDYQPDIVHSHSVVSFSPWVWKAAKDYGAVTVHTLQDYDLLCIRAALFKDNKVCVTPHLTCSMFAGVKRQYHGYIDHVVGCSNSILQTHLDHGFFTQLPATSRHVISNPVASAARKPRRTARLRSDRLTFGFIGRLVPEKGILTLLRACRALPASGWQLKIAGRAPKDDSDLRALAEGLPIEFVGFVDQGKFFEDIDVLAVPTIWAEPFGLTVVEAYAAGVPVLGARVAGTAELVGAVNPAWLMDSDDASQLAAKMAEMMQSGNGYLAGFQDPSAVLDRAAPGAVVDGYLDVYRAALGQASREVDTANSMSA